MIRNATRSDAVTAIAGKRSTTRGAHRHRRRRAAGTRIAAAVTAMCRSLPLPPRPPSPPTGGRGGFDRHARRFAHGLLQERAGVLLDPLLAPGREVVEVHRDDRVLLL